MGPSIREQLQAVLCRTHAIERELGGGGMSLVFLAEELRFKRRVVVKVLSPELALGVSVERFEREIQTAAALQQANIVPVLSAGDVNGLPYYTMPFVEGESLRARLVRGSLAVSDVVSLLRDVTRALAYAHERGVVHRDIKPDNVLLSGGAAVVTDFGIAKAITAARTGGSAATLTQTGMSVGTPAYMSPEQAAGDPDIDQRADLYSFGCLAYELLSGHAPFAGRSPQGTVAAHLTENPRPISELRDGLPPVLAELVMRCLAKERTARPAAAADIARDLDSITTVRDTTSPPGSINRPWRALLEWRVPQVVAAYAGLAWALVQGIGFLEARYGLSPHWTSVAWLTLLLLLPSIVFLTYQRGRRGRNRWTRAEAFGIPLNVLVAVAVLFLVFGGRDLGAVVSSVEVQDELGQTIEREVPKASYRRRILLFNFDASAQDTTIAWLRDGLPIALVTDLAQNMFLDVTTSDMILPTLRQAGFEKAEGIPLSLKQKIAEERNLPYFAEATIARSGDQIIVDLTVRQTARSMVLRQRSFSGTDVFALVDDMSAALGEALRLPRNMRVKDLPVSEFLVTTAAFRNYVEAYVAMRADQWPRAVALFTEAVTLEPTFALAQLGLHNAYLFSSQSAKSMPPLQRVLDNLYRLPERVQYDVKAEYHVMKGDQVKALAAAKMKVELFPEDLAGYTLVAQLQQMRGDRDGAMASYERILELDPTRKELLRQIGAQAEAKGDLDAALRYYSRYARQFPADHEAVVSLAGLHRLRGEHQQARQHFERALLLKTGSVRATVGLARLDRDLGLFDTASRLYHDALELARSPDDRPEALRALADYYEFRGQLDRSIEYVEELVATRPQAFASAMLRSRYVSTYVRAGQVAAARRIVQQLSQDGQSPFRALAFLVDAELNLALARPDDAERALSRADEAPHQLDIANLKARAAGARGLAAELRGACGTAIPLFVQSIQLDPTDATAHVPIARCYRKLGQTERAIERAERTLRVRPFHGPANYEIALAYLDSGDRGRALEHLRRAARTWSNADANLQQALEAKQKLREVEAGRF